MGERANAQGKAGHVERWAWRNRFDLKNFLSRNCTGLTYTSARKAGNRQLHSGRCPPNRPRSHRSHDFFPFQIFFPFVKVVICLCKHVKPWQIKKGAKESTELPVPAHQRTTTMKRLAPFLPVGFPSVSSVCREKRRTRFTPFEVFHLCFSMSF